MRITIRILVVGLGLCLSVTAAVNAQQLQDYTGTWKVDPDKVQAKTTLVNNPPENAPDIPPPPPADHRYTLEQIRLDGKVLKISGGEAGTTGVYTIDPSGKEVSDPIPDSTPIIVRIATTSWSEGKLVTKWKMERDGEAFMHGTDVRSLAPEGTLLVTREIESAEHRAQIRLVLGKVH
jgi:hypothetical protein